jgi:hypothetical protein
MCSICVLCWEAVSIRRLCWEAVSIRRLCWEDVFNAPPLLGGCFQYASSAERLFSICSLCWEAVLEAVLRRYRDILYTNILYT